MRVMKRRGTETSGCKHEGAIRRKHEPVRSDNNRDPTAQAPSLQEMGKGRQLCPDTVKVEGRVVI